jgi:hypothetical protein
MMLLTPDALALAGSILNVIADPKAAKKLLDEIRAATEDQRTVLDKNSKALAELRDAEKALTPAHDALALRVSQISETERVQGLTAADLLDKQEAVKRLEAEFTDANKEAAKVREGELKLISDGKAFIADWTDKLTAREAALAEKQAAFEARAAKLSEALG